MRPAQQFHRLALFAKQPPSPPPWGPQPDRDGALTGRLPPCWQRGLPPQLRVARCMWGMRRLRAGKGQGLLGLMKSKRR
jgi:hypothetical protein